MPQFRETQTGAVVNVPDEKAEQVLAFGYYEPVDGKAKAPAKKAAAKKSSK